MSKEITNSVDLAFAMLRRPRPVPGPSITEHQQRKLGMTQEQLASVGRGTLVAHEPQAGLRAGLFADEPDDAPPIQRDATVVQGLDGETASAVAAALAADRRRTVAKPVVEPEPAEKPESEAKRAIRVATENLEKIAKIKSDLASYARKHGVDLNKPAVDPAIEAAQRKADERKRLLEEAVKAAESKRAAKDRKRAAKALSKLGL